MTGRDIVLGKIRRSLGADTDDGRRHKAVADRLRSESANLIPDRTQISHREQIDLFQSKAESVQARILRLAGADGIPDAIAGILREGNLPASLRMGADPILNHLPWEKTPQLERLSGPSDGSDAVGLSRAFGGVAETGTLVLVSGNNNPTSLNFLPETHIVILEADDISGSYEAVLKRVRETYGKGVMPRTVNMITGPSLSGDIEQTLIHGAHGPRDLHILIIDPPDRIDPQDRPIDDPD